MKIAVVVLMLLATVALGGRLEAQGTGSASLWGVSNTHNGLYSATGGVSNTTGSSADYAVALGYGNNALGYYSMALGIYCTTVANSHAACAFGWLSTAYSDYSMAQGYNSMSYGIASVAMGNTANAFSTNCFAFGANAKAGDPGGASNASLRTNFTDAYAFGNSAEAKNFYAYALAASSHATGASSKTLGDSSTASGQHSITLGQAATASGDYSISLGQNSTAQAQHAVVIGPNAAAPRGSTNSWNTTDPIFIVANGQNSGAKSNAVEVLQSGTVLINPSGDLSMGAYTSGRKPGDP